MDNINKLVKLMGIIPNKNLGQHFLVDKKSMDLLTQGVSADDTIIEIGAGVGQITEILARKAKKVIAVEIDKRYKLLLDQIAKQYHNVEIIYANALKIRLDKLARSNNGEIKIIANLPYHISEPFLHRLSYLDIKNSRLIVGKRLVDAMQAQVDSPDFGQLTLLIKAFFKVEVIALIDKDKIIPPPRVESAIIAVTSKQESELNIETYLLRKLFHTASKSPLVKNALKEAIIGYYSEKSLTQNQAREIIKKMNIPDYILGKPFQQLNNKQLSELSSALKIIYS